MAEWEIENVAKAEMDDVRFLINRLDAYNLEQAPSKYMHKNIRLFVRGEHGRIIGGFLGMIHMHCLVIQVLFIEDDFRGQGMGHALMAKAEALAKETDARWVTVETASFQAKPFYEGLGYVVVAELEDIPEGGSIFILKKRL